MPGIRPAGPHVIIVQDNRRSALIFASANAQIVSDRVRPAEVSDCGYCGNHRSGGCGPYCLTNFCTTPLSCAR